MEFQLNQRLDSNRKINFPYAIQSNGLPSSVEEARDEKAARETRSVLTPKSSTIDLIRPSDPCRLPNPHLQSMPPQNSESEAPSYLLQRLKEANLSRAICLALGNRGMKEGVV
jgi:hypothetical protein